MSVYNSELLIVEDNPNDFHFLERIISKEKYEMQYHWCQDGARALDYFSNNTSRPVAVLLDIKLPKVNGLEVLKALKENPATRDIPVIMFSTSNQPSDMKEAYRLGANSYLVKPSNYQELKEMVYSIYKYWFIYNQTFTRND